MQSPGNLPQWFSANMSPYPGPGFMPGVPNEMANFDHDEEPEEQEEASPSSTLWF